MRRAGFEISVSHPWVLMREDPRRSAALELIKDIRINSVDDAFVGDVVNASPIGARNLTSFGPQGSRTRVGARFHGPLRGFIGFHSELLTLARGTAFMHRIFRGYTPFEGLITERLAGLKHRGDGSPLRSETWSRGRRSLSSLACGSNAG